MKREVKIIVDCNNLCYISAYAMKGLSFRDKDTGVIFGFLSQIYRLAKRFKTNKFIFCWDSRRSYRSLVYPEYKANRRKSLSDDDLKDLKLAFSQFTQLRKTILPVMGFLNVFHQIGYEADDLIGWVVARFPDRYVIASSDNDIWQLLSEGHKGKVFTRIFNLRTKKLFTYEDFYKGWGVTPYDWILVKSIAGDSGDNIKGIGGVGLLTASKHVRGELKGKKKDKIECIRGQNVIRRNFPLIALPNRGRKEIDVNKISEKERFYSLDFKDIFIEYGFNSFLKNFDSWRKIFKLRLGRS